MTPRRLAIALLLAAAVSLAGCGDNGGDEEAAAPTPPAPVGVAPAAVPTPPAAAPTPVEPTPPAAAPAAEPPIPPAPIPAPAAEAPPTPATPPTPAAPTPTPEVAAAPVPATPPIPPAPIPAPAAEAPPTPVTPAAPTPTPQPPATPVPTTPAAPPAAAGTLVIPVRPGLTALAYDPLQAVRGRNLYDEMECGACHGATLRGEPPSAGPGGPPLMGEAFATKWFGGTVWDLYKHMHDTMPPNEAGGLEDTAYVAMLTFLMRDNGLTGLPVWLNPDRAIMEPMGFAAEGATAVTIPIVAPPRAVTPEPAVPPTVPTPGPEPTPPLAAVPPEPVAPAVPPVPPDDPVLLRTIATADADAGEAVAARCQACHTFERGGAAGVGPNLFDIVGANVARSEGFNYSAAFRILGTEGATWTYTLLDDFLRSPALAILGNRMGFAGVADDGDRADLIAFLRRLSNDPMPLAGLRGESAAEAAAPPLPAGFNPLEFTRGQTEVGRDAYVNLGCAACHGGTLTGTADGPALVGDAFAAAWFGGTVYSLFDRLRSTMPPNNPAGLDDPRYAELLAYILQQNGFVVRGRPLRTDPAILEITRFIQPD